MKVSENTSVAMPIKNMIGIGYSVRPRTLAVSVLTKWLWCVFDQLLVGPDYDFGAAEFP